MLVRVLSSAAGVSSEGDGVGAAGANGGGLGHTHVPPHAAATAERSAMMNECTMSITLLVRALYSLCKVLLQLEKETILVSSLRSVTCLVQQHYRKLEGEEEKGKNEEGEEEKEEEEREEEEGKEEQEKRDGGTRTGQQNLDSQAESSDLEPGEVTKHSLPTSGEGSGDMRERVPGCDQSQEGEHGSIVCQTGDPGEVGQCSWDTLTVHSAAAQTLGFVQPFVEDIHQRYCSVNMVSGLCECTHVARRTISKSRCVP